MTWATDIVTIAGPAGVVSALVSHGLSTWNERRSTHRQSRYLALRIAILLEHFAGDCINLVSTVDVAIQLNANPETLPTELPALAEFPQDDTGWRAIDGDLAHRALTIPVERSARQGAINQEWAYGGPSSAPFECSRQAAIIGWDAWQVAAALRAAHHLPRYVPEHRFDESLRQRIAQDEAARLKNAADFAARIAGGSR